MLGLLEVWTPAEASRNSVIPQDEAHVWRIGGKLHHSTQKVRGGVHLFTTSGDDSTNHTCADEFAQRALSHHQMPSASVALAGCMHADTCRRIRTCTRLHYYFLLSLTRLICQTSVPEHGSSRLLLQQHTCSCSQVTSSAACLLVFITLGSFTLIRTW